MATARIIAIGDEILYGQTLNTNAHWLSKALVDEGVVVSQHKVIADTKKDIVAELKSIKTDITIFTGGLGPTSDDITKTVLAEHFKAKLILNKETLGIIYKIFKKKGYHLTDRNEKQAMLPENCIALINKNGTAPGMWFEKDSKIIIALPGIPYEMKPIVAEDVIPRLKEVFKLKGVYHRFVKIVGVGESDLSDELEEWEANLPKTVSIAYLPSYGEIKLRLTTKDGGSAKRKTVDDCVESLTPLIGDFIYGYDDDTLVSVVSKLLIDKGLKIAVAESCTGGYLSHRLTELPGASKFFKGSIVAYDNDVKVKVCKVGKDNIELNGVVSETVAKEMALSITDVLKTRVGIGITGIAGPTGGTDEKPVGTVHISAYYNPNLKDSYISTFAIRHKRLVLGKLRDENIKRTTTAALYLIWEILKKTLRG